MTSRDRSLLLVKECTAGEAILQLAPDDPNAIAEGRVFIDRRRVKEANTRLCQGQWLTCYAARRSHGNDINVESLILARRRGMVAVAKPASWASEPDRTGSTHSLREHLARLLRIPDVHIATRLDIGVSGLVLAATSADTRQHLAKVMASGDCHRRYLAVTMGAVPLQGQWEGAVEAPASSPRHRHALTRFQRIAQLGIRDHVHFGRPMPCNVLSMVVLSPQTGHRHQLRIHSSRAGVPILGDRRFGGATRFTDESGSVTALDRIYLHAFATTVRMPGGEAWNLQCPVPEELRDLWHKLGGTPADFVNLP